MSAVFAWLREFWANWGPWITVSLIPTIITGLSLSPKTTPAATWVQKAWNTIKQFLDLLSIATPKDRPGTFQLPLKMGRLKKKDDSDPPVPPNIGTGCAALMLLALLHGQAGCAWFHSDTMNDIKQAGIDCTVEAVKSNAASLLPVIMAVVTGHTDNWKQQLEAIGKEFGRDALACALRMASTELQNDMSLAATPEEKGKVNSGMVRTNEYTQEQHYTYVEPK